MKIYIGLNANQFRQVLLTAKPILLPRFKSYETLKLALHIYLMKLRTNHTHAQIAPLFNISHFTVGAWIRKIRPLVHKAMVPLFLYNRSRNDLLRNTTPLSRKIYEGNDETVVLTLDATYAQWGKCILNVHNIWSLVHNPSTKRA